MTLQAKAYGTIYTTQLTLNNQLTKTVHTSTILSPNISLRNVRA
jgi:hypothetical protein